MYRKMKKSIDWSVYRNFAPWEFTCRCCSTLNVDPNLVEALQVLRDRVNRPVKITSGCRCISHNSLVGGSSLSRHRASPTKLVCTAADFFIPNMGVLNMYKFSTGIEAFASSGIGVYPNHGIIHVDVGRSSSTRWGKLDGNFVELQTAIQYLIDRGRRGVPPPPGG